MPEVTISLLRSEVSPLQFDANIRSATICYIPEIFAENFEYLPPLALPHFAIECTGCPLVRVRGRTPVRLNRRHY